MFEGKKIGEEEVAWVSEVRSKLYKKTLKMPKVPIKNQLERNNGILFNSILTIALLKRALHCVAKKIKCDSCGKHTKCIHKWFCGCANS